MNFLDMLTLDVSCQSPVNHLSATWTQPERTLHLERLNETWKIPVNNLEDSWTVETLHGYAPGTHPERKHPRPREWLTAGEKCTPGNLRRVIVYALTLT